MAERHLSIKDLERLATSDLARVGAPAALAHLSGCRECRERLNSLSLETRGPIETRLSVPRRRVPHSLSSYAGALSAAFSKISEESRELDRQRALAPALLADLAGLSRTQQKLLIGNSPKYQSWAVAEELLQESRRRWTEDPCEGGHLAWVATEITEALPARGFRARILNDLKAEAWSYVGNCRRVQADLRGANEAFSKAAKYLEAGTGDLFERAQFEDLRASLFREERRFADAAQLLHNVVKIYREAGDERLEARSLLTLAKVLGDSGEVERCLETIRRAVSLLETQNEPWLNFVAKVGWAYYLDDSGRASEAQALIPELRQLARQHGNRFDRLRVLWTEGRIWRSLGHVELAEEALKQVRAGFVDAEIGYDVALVSLDLAALYLGTGRIAEVKELAAEMLPQFAARQIHREALAAIALFEQAARKERATLALVQEISSKVKDASTRRTPVEGD